MKHAKSERLGFVQLSAMDTEPINIYVLPQ